MDTIFIDDLIVSGKHGITRGERMKTQRFSVSIAMQAFRGIAHTSGDIDDALDYRPVKEILMKEIGKHGPFQLIETIAERIASRILETTKAESVTVSLKKKDIWKDGTPGLSITRHKLPQRIRLRDFDFDEAVHRLREDGACTIPILPKVYLEELFGEAERYAYTRQPEMLSGGKVREQLSSFQDLPEASLFHKLSDDLTELLRVKSLSYGQMLFEKPLRFNELSLQKYEKGSIGVTPHKEGKSYINLIAVFMLGGRGRFALCTDRTGKTPKYFDTTPGNLILMRGVGFFGRNDQPLHFVNDITSERTVFTLRQKAQ